MANVETYSKEYCPFCRRAVALLTQKGVEFSITDILDHPAQRDVMITRANGHSTVPQIFINDAHIGGCDDLFALEYQGKLDALLA